MVRAPPASIGSGYDLERDDLSVAVIAFDLPIPARHDFSLGIGMCRKSKEAAERRFGVLVKQQINHFPSSLDHGHSNSTAFTFYWRCRVRWRCVG